MGYASLEPHLPSSHTPLLPPGIFLSITDTQASDGNFLLHHFISNYIKADHNVVLVGLAGILVHYAMVGRKLGVNLATARSKGNFHFVDGMTQLTDYAAPNKDYLAKPADNKQTALAASTVAKPAASAPTAPIAPLVLSYSPRLSDLYKVLEELIKTTASKGIGQQKQICVILDDLSVLLNCGWPCRDVLALVRYLKLLVGRVNGSLITLVHADGVMAEDVSQDGLVKGVFYEADYAIDVRGLDSGGSRDVHGQLSLLHGPGYLLRLRAGLVKENEWPALTLHYKTLDNNVEVFAKGYSAGHVCNHAPSSVSESLDEIEFSRSIHAACIANNVERVRSILSKGSSRGGVSPSTALDSAGYTALHYASRAGNKEICTLLLNAGADVDAKTPELGATALLRAVQQNHLDVTRLLVSYGADLADCNADQENVFHVLACAASKPRSDRKGEPQDPSEFLDLARWLRTKAAAQGKLDSLLRARDSRSQRPMDHLEEQSSIHPLLAPAPTDL
ncbi:Elongator subunit elp6 [Mortierella alpina]|uniref:Elongator subunit elp6 n=1 Tax=Mortierella alpina TaxID=64518 RepID=A0A9P6M4U4_MORAP|nr:Elongator subunit elp6 [Mortierella alpina]